MFRVSEEFKELVKKVKGDSSIQDFAKMLNISTSYANKLINGTLDKMPDTYLFVRMDDCSSGAVKYNELYNSLKKSNSMSREDLVNLIYLLRVDNKTEVWLEEIPKYLDRVHGNKTYEQEDDKKFLPKECEEFLLNKFMAIE